VETDDKEPGFVAVAVVKGTSCTPVFIPEVQKLRPLLSCKGTAEYKNRNRKRRNFLKIITWPLTTATATKPGSLSSVSTTGVKNVQFSDQARVVDSNKSNVVTEPVREEGNMPPPLLLNMGRLSSTVKITSEGRQIPQFHASDYVNLPAFQIEARKIPQSYSESNFF
jgi:hypothetical protein